MKTRLVTRLPDKCVHVFQATSGREVWIECSEEEYRALGRKGAGHVPLSDELPKEEEGWRWVKSMQCSWYDTPNGLLSPGDVCDEGEEVRLVLPDSEGSAEGEDVFLLAVPEMLRIEKDGSVTLALEHPRFSLADGELTVK